jgi:hypothetical protein
MHNGYPGLDRQNPNVVSLAIRTLCPRRPQIAAIWAIVQTIEDLLGLARLRGAACACTPSLQALLAGTRG